MKTETELAERLSREARAYALGIYHDFTKAHTAVGATLTGKDPAIWDFFVAIAAMGLACLGAPKTQGRKLAKATSALLASRHPDAGRALNDFVAAAAKAEAPADFAGAWVLTHMTLRKPSPAEAAAARPLGELLAKKFDRWAAIEAR
ncbi:MAG: hypothetical protein HY925_16390 [Elusimicrobia bacterium]|nr:hypothetical protein [Elusimicrobiota bacterium]